MLPVAYGKRATTSLITNATFLITRYKTMLILKPLVTQNSDMVVVYSSLEMKKQIIM